MKVILVLFILHNGGVFKESLTSVSTEMSSLDACHQAEKIIRETIETNDATQYEIACMEIPK